MRPETIIRMGLAVELVLVCIVIPGILLIGLGMVVI